MRVAGFVVALGALLAAGCGDPSTEAPPDTVGALPEPTDIGTISPIIVDTVPPEVGTAPPGSIFGGDPCTALVAVDFSRVTFAAVGSGTLADFFPPSIDSCQYTVEVGDDQFVVVVQIRTQAEFEDPVVDQPVDTQPGDTASDTTLPVIEEIDDIGNAARGVARGDDYEVIVAVDNGWFSVRTPDETSATYLAGRAATRAG